MIAGVLLLPMLYQLKEVLSKAIKDALGLVSTREPHIIRMAHRVLKAMEKPKPQQRCQNGLSPNENPPLPEMLAAIKAMVLRIHDLLHHHLITEVALLR